MSLQARQLDLLRGVMAWDPPVWIFGGVAEDALLHGRMTRPHEDLDVLVFRDEIHERIAQARKLGFHDFHLRMTTPAHEPLVVGSIVNGVNLEFVLFDRAPDGRIALDLPVPDGAIRVFLPSDALDHPEATIEGVRIRTVSPLALYHIRASVAETFGGFRPKDRVTQAALRRRFFQDADAAVLAPEVVRGAPEPAPLA